MRSGSEGGSEQEYDDDEPSVVAARQQRREDWAARTGWGPEPEADAQELASELAACILSPGGQGGAFAAHCLEGRQGSWERSWLLMWRFQWAVPLRLQGCSAQHPSISHCPQAPTVLYMSLCCMHPCPAGRMLRDQLDSVPGCAAQITTVLMLAACRLGDAELGETLVKKCAGRLNGAGGGFPALAMRQWYGTVQACRSAYTWLAGQPLGHCLNPCS